MTRATWIAGAARRGEASTFLGLEVKYEATLAWTERAERRRRPCRLSPTVRRGSRHVPRAVEPLLARSSNDRWDRRAYWFRVDDSGCHRRRRTEPAAVPRSVQRHVARLVSSRAGAASSYGSRSRRTASILPRRRDTHPRSGDDVRVAAARRSSTRTTTCMLVAEDVVAGERRRRAARGGAGRLNGG